MITRHLRLAEEVDFAAVAAHTPGFVGADLAALAKEAAALAVRRIFSRLEAVRSLQSYAGLCQHGACCCLPAKLLEAVRRRSLLCSARMYVNIVRQSIHMSNLVILQRACASMWLLASQEADALERFSQPDSREASGAAEPAAPAAPAHAEPGSQAGFVRRRRAPLNAGDLASLAITAGDFEAAVSRVQPSVRREGFATTPDVTWADVGSLEEVRC